MADPFKVLAADHVMMHIETVQINKGDTIYIASLEKVFQHMDSTRYSCNRCILSDTNYCRAIHVIDEAINPGAPFCSMAEVIVDAEDTL